MGENVWWGGGIIDHKGKRGIFLKERLYMEIEIESTPRNLLSLGFVC